MGKVVSSFDEAVRDIPDGSVIAFAGFAAPGMPLNLTAALKRQGARNLTCVSNRPGGGVGMPADTPDVGILVENGQIRKMISSFTAGTRARQNLAFERFYEAGQIEAELVPQGTLVERLRAAGAGIPAFYTPTGWGTEIADGKEVREFNGRGHVLELALPVDYAFLRARRADLQGNLQYRLSQRNFNPVMAMAARTVIVEVEEDFVEPGEMDPDQIHTPGILVHRMVRIPPPPKGYWPLRPGVAA